MRKRLKGPAQHRARVADTLDRTIPREFDGNPKLPRRQATSVAMSTPRKKQRENQEDKRGNEDRVQIPDPNQGYDAEASHEGSPGGAGVIIQLASPGPVNAPVEALRMAEALLVDFASARSPLTLKAYRTDLADFSQALGTASTAAAVAHLIGGGPGEANRVALRYREHLQNSGRAPATVARRLATLRSLCRVARMVGAITWTLDLAGPRLVAYRDTRGPGRAGFQRLLQAAEDQLDPKRSRDLAILWLLYGRALRRSEVCRLTVPHDTDLAGGRIRIHGKHRAEPEWVTIPPATVRALTQWLMVRGVARGPLFTRLDRVAAEAKRMSGEHGPLTGEAIRQLVRDLGQRVNVQTRPHGLRHAAITEALAATHGDLRAVQRYARLKSANTIKLYDDERSDLGGEVARLLAP